MSDSDSRLSSPAPGRDTPSPASDSQPSGQAGRQRPHRSAISCLMQGLGDALNVVLPIQLLYGDKAVQESTYNCFILNGGIFIGSLALFHVLIHPAIYLILSSTWREDSKLLSDEGDIRLLQSLMFAVYNILWVYPMFLLAKILNSQYYQSVANASYGRLKGQAAPGYGSLRQLDFVSWISINMADLLYTIILEVFLLIEASVLGLVPYIGGPLSFAFNCWVASLYCFEYAWINSGWDLRQRIVYFERHWVYFLGFGAPVTALTFFMDMIYGSATFSLLFPIFIMMATGATPKHVPEQSSLPANLPICTPSKQLTNWLVGYLGPRSFQLRF